jgi:hypothetical protein
MKIYHQIIKNENLVTNTKNIIHKRIKLKRNNAITKLKTKKKK